MENETPSESVEQLDVEKVKSMLNLPATATDVELIGTLVNLIANLQEKYEALLTDAVKVEDELVNRVQQDYADVIDETTAAYWNEQILANRDGAITALDSIRAKAAAAAPAPVAEAPAPSPRMIPLANRALRIPSTKEIISGAESADISDTEAVAIRNRATELVQSKRLSFTDAFQTATAEFIANRKASI